MSFLVDSVWVFVRVNFIYRFAIICRELAFRVELDSNVVSLHSVRFRFILVWASCEGKVMLE